MSATTCDAGILLASTADRDLVATVVLVVILGLAALVGSPGMYPTRRRRVATPRHAQVRGRRSAVSVCAEVDILLRRRWLT